jgi:hypothetical protein
LAVTYVEKRIRDTLEERKSWCWQSWSAAICQIKRQAKKLLKEINYKTPKEIMRTLKRKCHYTRFAKEKKKRKR